MSIHPVTDDRSQLSQRSQRFRSRVRLVAFVLFIASSFGWAALYSESVYQRRKAESLISDLRKFPFASTNFTDVRALVDRHEGSAVVQFPRLRPPVPGVPSRDSQGRLIISQIQAGPTCTVQQCTFEVSIKNWLADTFSLPLGRSREPLLSALGGLGIRPWWVYASFEVADGKLQASRTSVTELRRDRLRQYKELLPSGYNVTSYDPSKWWNSDRKFTVGFPHVTGGPLEVLSAEFVQTTDAPIQRAFDIHMSCLTAVTGCDSFDELVPSAWADYQRLKKRLSP